MKTVGVIGGSGFIGSHITKQFLDNGFEVKVSATDLSKKEKYTHLEKLDHSDHLHISQLDVKNKAQLKSFIKDCEIVIHGGTSFQLDVTDPQKELIDPTIKGTENFLEVISKSHKVKKIIFIASVAAWNTNFPLPAEGKSASDIFSEVDTPFINKESHPYAQAKFMANQTVNEFIKSHPNLDIEITSVSPVAVFGKSMSERDDSTSTGLQFLIKNNLAPNRFVKMLFDTNAEFAVVDVEDVAKGIYNAATISGLHGKNYLLSSESYPVSDLSLMLNGKQPKNQPKIIYQNSMAQGELGIPFRPVKSTLGDF
ncbi:NAD-dependent epimerase/dehydratase family protein [uncultured Gelidibacter sp.]|uniref:NAD-dependent epimerase/dehydratase family protein n=1 Tax=uncultured Gelidibacter sp. TaxID=259318 RepID=UPI002617BFA9|nr:NAD-dependent epimerase/dehydratase family protein [uncultured Gelidibacter sp.]